MISQIHMPKGALFIKDISHAEFDSLLDKWKSILEVMTNDGQSKIIIIGGHEIEYIPFDDRALELWRKFIKWSGDDPYQYEPSHDGICFFCGKFRKEPHSETCMYMEAKKLIEAVHD